MLSRLSVGIDRGLLCVEDKKNKSNDDINKSILTSSNIPIKSLKTGERMKNIMRARMLPEVPNKVMSNGVPM